MNNSSFNHSNKERRLIHFAGEAPSTGAEDTPANQLDALKNQVAVDAQDEFMQLAIDWKKAGVTPAERLQVLQAVSTLSDLEQRELLANSANFAKVLGPDGVAKIVELHAAQRVGDTAAFNRIVESMTPEDRDAFLKANTEVFQKFQKALQDVAANPNEARAREMGDQISSGLKRFAEALAPILKMLAEIMKDVKAMIQDFQDQMEYDPNALASKDRFIDKQIADSKTKPEFIAQHKNNTIDEINGIDKGGNPTAIKAKKTEVADLKKEKKDKLADAKPGSETIKVTKEFDGYVADAEKQLNEMESKLRTGKARRPILMARLKRINSRFGLSAEDGLNSSSSDRVAETEPAAPTKTPEEIETEAKVAAMKKAKAALSFIDTMLKERKEKDDEVDVKIAELNTALLKMDESEREAFVTSEKIQPTTLASGDSDHRMIETVEGTVYEVKYKDDFALDFVKYEAGAEV